VTQRNIHIAARSDPGLTIPMSELNFSASRSSGPGGQNVNKLETRIELRFDVRNSPSLSEFQKTLIEERLGSRIDERGILRIVSQDSRSQWQNKQAAIERFIELIGKALRPVKKRKQTNPTRSSREHRLQSKRIHSEKKRLRRPARGED
jgi:ribosome-associated protein